MLSRDLWLLRGEDADGRRGAGQHGAGRESGLVVSGGRFLGEVGRNTLRAESLLPTQAFQRTF